VLVNRIGTDHDYWFATILSGSFLEREAGEDLPAQLRNSELLNSITHSAGGLRFGQPDQLSLHLVTRSSGDAEMLSGLLKVAGGLARCPSGGNARSVFIGQALSSMQVSVEGASVRASSAIADQQLAAALASPN
jgi:hypothetical protein